MALLALFNPMAETLYRKYRPKNFSEIIGQTHIVRTLGNAVSSDRIGQAYLFTGPRGTGKTSIARILAKTVNCPDQKKSIPCEKCPSCKTINEGRSLDIIEIDAASNTGVDNIRELKETVALPPTSLKFKVYIIDEVHMLSTGAFNALLKTLEEPPTHVIFILATTEIHKVPDTIISRCQRFDFTRLPLQNIIEKLSLIAKEEKVKIGKEALEMIALASEGGMRDAESLFSQIITLEDKNITTKEVEEILGSTDRKVVHEIAEMILENDSTGAISKVNGLLDDGYDLAVFNKSLVNYLRQVMLLKINEKLSRHFSYEMTKEQLEKTLKLVQKAELFRIIDIINLFLKAQTKISSFILPQLPLEIAIIKATNTFPVHLDNKIEINNQKPISINQKIEIKERETEKETADAPKKNESVDMDTIRANWNKLLVEIRPFNHSLNALLFNCQVLKVKGNEITLGTPYEFYRERLAENSNRLTIEEVFSKILGLKVTITTVIDKSLAKKTTPEEIVEEKNSTQDPLLDSALEIMGGKVVE